MPSPFSYSDLPGLGVSVRRILPPARKLSTLAILTRRPNDHHAKYSCTEKSSDQAPTAHADARWDRANKPIFDASQHPPAVAEQSFHLSENGRGVGKGHHLNIQHLAACPSSRPQLSVQRTILDCFGDVLRCESFGPRQVGKNQQQLAAIFAAASSN